MNVDVPAAVLRTERAMDRVFGFLAQDAGNPHLRLLPYRRPLIVVSAFFDRFPTASERARRLLARWLWRGIATEELRGDGKGMRPALEALRFGDTDDLAATRVLATVATDRPASRRGEPFNFRYARSRVLAMALVGLHPQHLATGERLDVQALLGSTDDPLPQIFGRPKELSDADLALFSSVGNRILHPVGSGATALGLLGQASPAALESHGLSEDAARLLRDGDRIRFLRTRRDRIEDLATDLVDSRAEWGHTDRPSIEAMSDAEE